MINSSKKCQKISKLAYTSRHMKLAEMIYFHCIHNLKYRKAHIQKPTRPPDGEEMLKVGGNFGFWEEILGEKILEKKIYKTILARVFQENF